jgi:hypothetical protein
MPVLEAEDLAVCAIDGCSRRFNLGWDGVCDECTALAADHEAGLHLHPTLECQACW